MLVDLYAPIEPRGYEIKRDKQKDLTYIALSVFNLSDKIITAIDLRLLCFDSFGKPVGGEDNNEVEVSFQDKVIASRSFYDSENVPLPQHPTTRTVEIIVNKVMHSGGTTWEKGDYELLDLRTEKVKGDDLYRLKEVAGKDAVCYAREKEKDFWQCVCGRANFPDAETCIRCEREKQFLINDCSSKTRVAAENERILKKAEEEEQKRWEKQEQEEKKRLEQKALEEKERQERFRERERIIREKLKRFSNHMF